MYKTQTELQRLIDGFKTLTEPFDLLYQNDSIQESVADAVADKNDGRLEDMFHFIVWAGGEVLLLNSIDLCDEKDEEFINKVIQKEFPGATIESLKKEFGVLN